MAVSRLSLTPKFQLFRPVDPPSAPDCSPSGVWFRGRGLAGPSLDNSAERVRGMATRFPADGISVCGREAKAGPSIGEPLTEHQSSPEPMSPGLAFLAAPGIFLVGASGGRTPSCGEHQTQTNTNSGGFFTP